jgi:hypothetical protein
MKNPERAISNLTGMVHGLFMTTQAILNEYPDPKGLLLRFADAEQSGLAQIETAPIPDAVIEGYQHVFGAFRSILEALAANLDNNGP